MSQLVRLEGKHSTQNAHCAMVRTRPLSATQIEIHPKSGRSQKIPLGVFFARKKS